MQCFGMVTAIVAAAVVALGVADVALTSQSYCQSGQSQWTYCSAIEEPYVWVWIAPGIWPALEVFVAGLCIWCSPSLRYLSLLVMLAALVFSPAIVILSAMEIWRGGSAQYTFYSTANGVSAGNITPSPNPYMAKFAIPLAVAVLGGILWLMSLFLLYAQCSRQPPGDSTVVIERPRLAESTYERPYIRPQEIAPPPALPHGVACNQYPVNPPPMPVRYNNCAPGYTCGGGVFNNYAQPATYYYK